MVDLPEHRTAILLVGLIANIASVAWFKLNPTAHPSSGDFFLVAGIPLGLSFYAFKQVTYLLDRYENRAPDAPLSQYLLFSTFFAHLPAGPITPYRVLQPQLLRLSSERVDLGLLAAGTALAIVGAFKLRFFSGHIGALTTPVYEAAKSGAETCGPEAVVASFGFLLELYYNFSGYSDIAIGIALCLGLRLSPNFDSPLKSFRLGDYVMRWHMSLIQFARNYFFFYLQRALARNIPFRRALWRRVAAWILSVLVTFPMVMLWHSVDRVTLAVSILGALAVIVASFLRLRSRPGPAEGGLFTRVVGFGVCISVASLSVVFLRGGDLNTALNILAGLGNWGGQYSLLSIGAPGVETCPTLSKAPTDIIGLAILFLAAAIAFLAPNSSRMFGTLPQQNGTLIFKPSLAWAAFLGVLGWLAWLSNTPLSGFVIYENF